MAGASTVELRVLGVFELIVDGQSVAIGSEKQRLLLAALAVDANRVVSEDRLIDALWDERPPATALATLQKYVYRLRGVLGSGQSDTATLRVETLPNGYSLIFGGAQLDADRFVGLVAEARRVACDDPAAALQCYDEALSVWRGPPWRDFADRDPFRTAATRLEEFRIAATEERVDIALDCGRHRELIVELEVIVAAYPLHERFRAQLMLALYRCGRKVDALRTFREFRSYLIAEIGLEPARELQELEDDIIQQKSHLDLRSDGPADTSSARVVPPFPAQLLGGGVALIGRSADLHWLEALWSRALSGEPQAAVLSGPAGIGKTHLLGEFARRVHAGGASVLYRSGEVGEVFPPATVLRTMSGTLIILDDLDALCDFDMAGLLSGVASEHTDAALLVIAARRSVPIENHLGPVQSHALTGFTGDDVATVLAEVAGSVQPGLAEAVLDETGGLPALVVAFAEQLREREVSTRLDRALECAQRAGSDLWAAQDEIGATALDRVRRGRRAVALTEGVCPYKGLAAFEASDAALFCGRDRLVATLVARLAVSRFLGVVGASGSGKSSLVRAGLVPSLASGTLPGSDGWATTVLTPGPNPIESLAQSMSAFSDDARRVVVIVDQFEELFTSCRDADVRDLFLNKLLAMATSSRMDTAVVIVLRADYYGMCAAHAGFARLLERSQVLVGAMRSSELRDAIMQPATRTGLRVDDALVDVVCRDAGSEPGALPLVSTALMETWARREDHTLTVAAYENAGGVQGALARLADRTYTGLDRSQRVVARRIFLRLAEVGEGNDDVRRRADRNEIDAIDGAPDVLTVLTDQRLVTVDRAGVEVAHEALLREWPKLRSWLEDDRDGRRLHLRLADAAAEWERDGRDPAALYRSAKLDAAAERASTHPDELTPTEATFVAASAAAQTNELQVARRSAQRSRAMAAGLAVLLAVALISATVGVTQWLRAKNASDRAGTAAKSAQLGRLDALARNLPTDRADLALLLGVEAHRMDPSIETEGALETALVHTPVGVERLLRFNAPTFNPSSSPNGRLLVYSDNGNLHLLDLQSGRVIRTLHADHPLAGASFNADGTELAASSTDGAAMVWNVTTGQQAGAAIRPPGGLDYPFFDPANASALYTVSNRGEVIRWDRHDPQHPKPIGEPFRFQPQTDKGYPPVVAISRDDRFLAIAPTNGPTSTTSVWDIPRHTLVHTFTGSTEGFAADAVTLLVSNGRDIDFRDARTGALRGQPLHGSANATPASVISQDGRTFAVFDDNDTIEVYNLTTRTRIGAPIAAPGPALPTSFLPDGRLIVSTPTQASIWRIGAKVTTPGVTLNDHGRQVAPWFVDNGRQVVTESWDDTRAALWESATGRRIRALARGGSVQDVSRDGRRVSSDLGNGAIGVWDLPSDQQIATIQPRLGPNLSSAFSPDGSLLAVTATQGHDPTVELWNVARSGSPRLVNRFAVPSVDGLVETFTNDGKSLLILDYPTASITLIDIASAQRRWTHTDTGMSQVAISPDNQTIAVAVAGATDTGVRFLDARTGKERGLLPVPDVSGITYLRGGRMIAASGGTSASTIQLYDTATLTPIGAPLSTPGTTWFFLDGSPDGNRIAAGTSNGFAVLWDVNVDDWEQTACRIAGRNLSHNEWNQYLPDQPYHATCPEWPTGQA
jgi:DNA-binding SARP family transcriptional activator/WD40 repeat protein